MIANKGLIASSRLVNDVPVSWRSYNGAWLITVPAASLEIANNSDGGSQAKGSPPPPQTFEWIQHGDASARRRARAHVTRGFRRHIVAEGQKPAEKEKGNRKEHESSKKDIKPNKGLDSDLDSSILEISSIQPYEIADRSYRELSLHPTLGSGHTDPFACLPIGSAPGVHALLDHCTYDSSLGKGSWYASGRFRGRICPSSHRQDYLATLFSLFDSCSIPKKLLAQTPIFPRSNINQSSVVLSGVAPLSFQQDARANFSHVTLLSFEASVRSPPALHIIISAAASDIAALHGKQDSRDAIVHRGIALSGVRKLMKQSKNTKIKDDIITAVTFLAGNEVGWSF